MKVEFLTKPPLGTRMMLDEQAYDLVAIGPHTRKDGSPTTLLTWATNCPECGSPVEVVTGLKIRDINRRCAEHRKPNIPVSPLGRKAVAVRVVEPRQEEVQ